MTEWSAAAPRAGLVALLWGCALGLSLPTQAQQHGSREVADQPAPARAAPSRPGAAPGQLPPARHGRGPVVRGQSAAPPARDGQGQVLDGRYNHGRYYPPLGAVRPSLPADYHPYYFQGRDRYYLEGGVWYAPQGAGFVVVRPPVGLLIPTLPNYCTTLWVGGVPYYYADNVYYAWQPAQNGYVVVDPPSDVAPTDAPPPPPAAGDLFVYPKNGQSQEQQAADEYECHLWAQQQTGFDPTQPDGGVPPGEVERSRNNYLRAQSACLLGRGYQVN